MAALRTYIYLAVIAVAAGIGLPYALIIAGQLMTGAIVVMLALLVYEVNQVAVAVEEESGTD